MKHFFALSGVGLVLLISSGVSADDSVIGYIKTISDETSIVENGKSVKAGLGSPIRIGNLIKTSEDGSAGLTLKDNTILSIGPNTEFKIDKYQFQPQNDQLELNASIIKGTLHYISGVIAKLKPDAVAVTTPTGVIAVRGTRFLVKIE